MREFKLAAATDRRGTQLGATIGQSKAMKQIFETIRLVADQTVSVEAALESSATANSSSTNVPHVAVLARFHPGSTFDHFKDPHRVLLAWSDYGIPLNQ